MLRTIQVSDDLHSKIKKKVAEIQEHNKGGKTIKMRDVVNVIIVNNLDKVDEYFDGKCSGKA